MSAFDPEYKHTGLDRIGNIEQWLVANGNGGSIPPKGNRVFSIGDSISVGNGSYLNVTGQPPYEYSDRNWQMWAQMFSNGQLLTDGVAATVGYTVQQIQSTHLPTALAQKSDACFVLGGTNNSHTTGLDAGTTSTLQAMYTSLLGAGIIPILCTIPPRAGGYSASTGPLNNWIARYARENGLPFVDFYSVLVDPSTGGYLAAYDNGDGLHPNAAGAKVMGQAAATALANMFPKWAPWLVGDNSDASIMNTNACMLTDTNADGIPDGFALSSGAGATTTLTTDAAVLGNVFTVTRGTADTGILNNGSGLFYSANPGDRIGVSWRMKMTTPSSGIAVRLHANTGTLLSRSIYSWTTADDNWRTYYMEGVMPSGATGCRVTVDLTGTGCKVSLAQLAQVNLTAKGIA